MQTEGRRRWISSLVTPHRSSLNSISSLASVPRSYHSCQIQLAQRSSSSTPTTPSTAPHLSRTKANSTPRGRSASANISSKFGSSSPSVFVPSASLRFEPWTSRLEKTPAGATCGVEEVARLCLQQEGKHHYAFFRPSGATSTTTTTAVASPPHIASISTPQDYLRLLHLLAVTGSSAGGVTSNLAIQISTLLFDLLRKPVHPQRGAASAWDLTNREVRQIKEEVIHLMMSRVLHGEAALHWLTGALGLEVYAPNGLPKEVSLRAQDVDDDEDVDDNENVIEGAPLSSPQTSGVWLTSALLQGWSQFLTESSPTKKAAVASSPGHRPFSVSFTDPHGEVLLFSSETIGLVASAMLQEQTSSTYGAEKRFEVLRLLDMVRRARLSCVATTATATLSSTSAVPPAARLLSRVNMKEIVVRCAEVAAQQGDSETVTRLIFLLSRSEGTLAGGSGNPMLHPYQHHQHHHHLPPSRVTGLSSKKSDQRQAWLRRKWSALVQSLWGRNVSWREDDAGAEEQKRHLPAEAEAEAVGLDRLTTRLLKSAIHASLVSPPSPSRSAVWDERESAKSMERLEEAYHLFVALSEGSNWSGAAAMAVELLTFGATWQQEAYQALTQHRAGAVAHAHANGATQQSSGRSTSKGLLESMKTVAQMTTEVLLTVRERLPSRVDDWTSGQRTIFVTCVELVCRTLTGTSTVTIAPSAREHGAERAHSPPPPSEVPVVCLPFTVRVPMRSLLYASDSSTKEGSGAAMAHTTSGGSRSQRDAPHRNVSGTVSSSVSGTRVTSTPNTVELPTHACIHSLFALLLPPYQLVETMEGMALGGSDSWLAPLLPFELVAMSEAVLMYPRTETADGAQALGTNPSLSLFASDDTARGSTTTAIAVVDAILSRRFTRAEMLSWDPATGGMLLYAGMCRIAASIVPQRCPSQASVPAGPSWQEWVGVERFSEWLREAPSLHRQHLWTVLFRRPHSAFCPQDPPPRLMEPLSVALYGALKGAAAGGGPGRSLFSASTAEAAEGHAEVDEPHQLLQALYHVGCPPEKQLVSVVDAVLGVAYPSLSAGLCTTSVEDMVRPSGGAGHGNDMVVVVTTSALEALSSIGMRNTSAESLLSSIRSLGGGAGRSEEKPSRVTFAMTLQSTCQILEEATSSSSSRREAHPLLQFWRESLLRQEKAGPAGGSTLVGSARLPGVRVCVLPPLDWSAESVSLPHSLRAGGLRGLGRAEGCAEAIHVAAVVQRCCPAESRALVFCWRERRATATTLLLPVGTQQRGAGGRRRAQTLVNQWGSASGTSDADPLSPSPLSSETDDERLFLGPEWRQCNVRLLSIKRAQLSKAKSDIRAVCSAQTAPALRRHMALTTDGSGDGKQHPSRERGPLWHPHVSRSATGHHCTSTAPLLNVLAAQRKKNT